MPLPEREQDAPTVVQVVAVTLLLEVGVPPAWMGTAFRSLFLDTVRERADMLKIDIHANATSRTYRTDPVRQLDQFRYKSAVVLFGSDAPSRALASEFSSSAPTHFAVERRDGPPRCRFLVEVHRPAECALAEFSPSSTDELASSWRVEFRSPLALASWPETKGPPPLHMLIGSIGFRAASLGFAFDQILHDSTLAVLEQSAIVRTHDIREFVPPNGAKLRRGVTGSALYECDDSSPEMRVHTGWLLRLANVIGAGSKTASGFGAIRYGNHRGDAGE